MGLIFGQAKQDRLYVDFETLSSVEAAYESVKMSIHDQSKRMSFETSEEVKVAPTFEAMGLKEDLLRGVYAYSTLVHAQQQRTSWLIVPSFRFREAIRHPAASYPAHHERKR